MRPIMTNIDAAPKRILHLVSCNCKTGCEHNCECKRSCLPCTGKCGYCAGHGCTNRVVVECNNMDDDDDGSETQEDSKYWETDIETITWHSEKREKLASKTQEDSKDWETDLETITEHI